MDRKVSAMHKWIKTAVATTAALVLAGSAYGLGSATPAASAATLGYAIQDLPRVDVVTATAAPMAATANAATHVVACQTSFTAEPGTEVEFTSRVQTELALEYGAMWAGYVRYTVNGQAGSILSRPEGGNIISWKQHYAIDAQTVLWQVPATVPAGATVQLQHMIYAASTSTLRQPTDSLKVKYCGQQTRLFVPVA